MYVDIDHTMINKDMHIHIDMYLRIDIHIDIDIDNRCRYRSHHDKQKTCIRNAFINMCTRMWALNIHA